MRRRGPNRIRLPPAAVVSSGVVAAGAHTTLGYNSRRDDFGCLQTTETMSAMWV